LNNFAPARNPNKTGRTFAICSIFPGRWAIPVLQELRETLTAATNLVAAIGIRFKAGDSADELIAQLTTLLTTLAEHAADLTPDLRTELTQLLARVEETVALGDNWLRQAGPELASQQTRERLRRTYGVP
jgi:hypothetical protein